MADKIDINRTQLSIKLPPEVEQARKGGRPKGTRKFNVEFLSEILDRRGVDWRQALADLAAGKPDVDLSCWHTLIPYLLPRLVTKDVTPAARTPEDSLHDAEQAKRLLDQLEGRQDRV